MEHGGIVTKGKERGEGERGGVYLGRRSRALRLSPGMKEEEREGGGGGGMCIKGQGEVRQHGHYQG